MVIVIVVVIFHVVMPTSHPLVNFSPCWLRVAVTNAGMAEGKARAVLDAAIRWMQHNEAVDAVVVEPSSGDVKAMDGQDASPFLAKRKLSALFWGMQTPSIQCRFPRFCTTFLHHFVQRLLA